MPQRSRSLGFSRVLACLLLALSALTAAGGRMAQDPPTATRPADPQLHGVGKVQHGLQEIGEGSQEIVDDLATTMRREWLEDGKVQAVVVVAEGEVDNFMRDSIRSRITTARNLGAEVVILQLDTYGGLVTAGLEISRFIKQQDDLFIVCFVDDKAISAGAMIALSCDQIAMEPATQIGDAGVIAVGPTGPESLDETNRAKVESPVLADFLDSARRNGYDPLLAEAFVKVSRSVYVVENSATGERRFVEGEEYDRLVNGGTFRTDATNWHPLADVRVPLDDDQGLLTLDDISAQAIGLSLGSFSDVQSLAADRGWMIVTTLRPSAGEKLVGLLSSYTLRGVLMTVLFLGIYMSLSHPGTGLPEVVSALCLGVLLGVPVLTGFAAWYEVVLVLVGILLLAIELFLIPGFGFAGVTGIILILGGLVMTFVAPLTPPGLPTGFGVDWTSLGHGVLTVVAGLCASVLLWFWLSRYLPKLPYASRLVLQDEVMTPDETARRAAAVWPLPGMVGYAVSDLRPGGTAKFAIAETDPDDTANADVVSDRGFIAAGTQLAVVEVEGTRVVVRPVPGNVAAG